MNPTPDFAEAHLPAPTDHNAPEQQDLPLKTPGVRRFVIDVGYAKVLVEEYPDGRLLANGSPIERYPALLVRART